MPERPEQLLDAGYKRRNLVPRMPACRTTHAMDFWQV